jgi:transglutaminase/protease-like cytokinesis protein 3
MTTEREYQEWEAKRRRKQGNKSKFRSPASKNKSKLNKSLIFFLFLGLSFITIKNNQEQIASWFQESEIINESVNLEKFNEISKIASELNSIQEKVNSKPITPAIPVSNPGVFNANYDRIDQVAKNLNYYGTSVKELAQLLNKYTQTEAEKARIIYTWIAHNITYDVPSFLGGTFSNIKPSDVLQKRLAVCSGYANLYQALAQEMGLEAVTINGYSKGVGYIVGNSTELNHGWNAVKIDKNWHLIDVTWGAGHIDNNRFVRAFNPFYFATPPEKFIYDHLPENPQWQLLANKFSREQFESLPETSAQFFKTGLRLLSHNTHTIQTDNKVTIRLAASPNIITTARLSSGNNTMPETYTFVQQSQGNITVNASFPTAGIYNLEIFAKDKDETGLYPHAITYKIIAKAGGAQFPKTYSTLDEHNGNLVTPLTYSLPKNTPVYFEVTLDNAVDVQIFNQASNQWTPLNRSGRTFSGNVVVTSGKTQLMARFPQDTTRYWSLAEYQ